MSGSFFLKYADSTKPHSAARSFRSKRMRFFEAVFSDILSGDAHILDIGGTIDFWESHDYHLKENIRITLLNVFPQESSSKNIHCLIGEARKLQRFRDSKFDIIFSNSVIEHVGPFSDQTIVADEIRKLGTYYFVQTPHYWFPLEPHFLFWGFQFLPLWLRAFLVRHFSLGWHKRALDKKSSLELAGSIHLLSCRRLRKLFPDALIQKEHIFGFVKSLIAYSSPKHL